jgi:hypothetical protein
MVAVLGWFKKHRFRKAPLSAAPMRARVKTYSSESGYVYQYVFLGQRTLTRAVEYVFEISYDRINRHQIAVVVADAEIEPWERANARELTSSQRYGVAKMALRNAFDRRPDPESMHETIAPRADEIREILEELGV